MVYVCLAPIYLCKFYQPLNQCKVCKCPFIQILYPFLSRFIIFLPKFILGNCKDNLNTWKDKADERRREMAALEVKISEENSKEKKVEGDIIFVFRTK